LRAVAPVGRCPTWRTRSHLFFLGAYGENNDFFEKTLIELLRDHVYWRRNFHPEDLPPIGTAEQYSRDYLDGLARTRTELHKLTASLKRSVPFFHPRYLGHMVSDLLMPGLIAQLVTTLYNPNNIVEDVAPVTVQIELEVGRQLATMLGFSTDAAREPCALGHLTSGGTVANDEALWLARAVKLYPLAVRDACEATGLWPDVGVALQGDDWALLNVSVERALELARRVATWCQQSGGQGDLFFRAVEAARVEATGLAAFASKHPLVTGLAVVVPATAHYSWQKAMKLLGLGSSNVIEVATAQARLDVGALEQTLAAAAQARRPVLAVIGVYGTTEFGTLDPLHEIAALRGRHCDFWFHVDAAWGGYIPSLFRDDRGDMRPREAVHAEFRYFPSERVYRSTAALAEADSVTVDPHKLGFVPFGAGAFVVRNRRVLDLVQQEAPYVFTGAVADDELRYRRLGRFIIEGSKPGAAAAACYVNHRVLPLDSQHFGRLIARGVQSCEQLVDRLTSFAQELEPWARVTAPFEPDCNLVCLALNPTGNSSLKAANDFGRRLFEGMSVRPDQPVQLREFFGSCTTVRLDHLGRGELERIGALLGLDLVAPDEGGLFLLRHTLMNPWLQSSPGQASPATSRPTATSWRSR
jgi:glutamate/tyrosine decarboxylase-like PLP-dependent enzyme